VKELEKLLEQLPAQIEATAHQTLLDAGKLGEEAARNTKLFKNHGALRAATNFHTTGQLSGFVLADKPYAGYLEDGNPYKGFKIVPKQAKVLHFKIDGKDIFVKSSTAHGPLPFMQQAQDKVEGEIENIFNHNFDKYVGR